MAPVACRPVIKCGKSCCSGYCPLSVVEYGYTAGKEPATCRTCGKTFPRPNVTLSDFLPAKNERKKGNRSRNSSPGISRRSRNVSPAVSRKSSVVSWSDSPREQSEANGEDAVMEDSTETHQAEINKKIKANDKLRKILTNMPEEHRTLIYGDSFKSKMESLDDEKAALLAAKRQFLPLQSRIDKTNRRTIWSESRKRSNRNRRSVWKSCKKWIEADEELEAANAKQTQAKHEMALLVAEQTAENAKKLSIKEIQGFSLTCQDPSLIKLHNTPFSQCSNPFSRCKAWGATVFRNSSWQLARPRRMSRKSVRLWHRQRGNWRQGSRPVNLVPRRIVFPCEVVGSDEEFSNGVCMPRIQQSGHRRTRNHQEEPVKRHHTKEASGEEMQTGRRRFVACSVSGKRIQIISVSFYLSLSRIGEADNPGPAHATAKLFGEQLEAIGQWATNLTSKSEMDLTPLLARVGKCRQMFCESSEKESYPYTSSVSQDIQGTHSHMGRFFHCLFPLSLAVTLHTLNKSMIISHSFKSVMSAMQVGRFRLSCSFVTGVAKTATTPFVITRREEDASTLERNANSKLLRVW